jgi:hypothetical protein
VLRQDAELLELRKRFLEDPTDLAHANRYWQGLAKIYGHADFRTAHYVVEAFGPAAVHSMEGAVALARAYQELFDLSGEPPKADALTPELRQALTEASTKVKGEDAAVINWVLYHANEA